MEGRTIDDETSFMLMTQPTNQPLQVFFILLNLLFHSPSCFSEDGADAEEMHILCIFMRYNRGHYLPVESIFGVDRREGFLSDSSPGNLASM